MFRNENGENSNNNKSTIIREQRSSRHESTTMTTITSTRISEYRSVSGNTQLPTYSSSLPNFENIKGYRQPSLQVDTNPIRSTVTTYQNNINIQPNSRPSLPPIAYRSPFNREFGSCHRYTPTSSANKNPVTRPTATLANVSSPSSYSLPDIGATIRDPNIPTYDTNGKNRAKVLIINNIKFLESKSDERKGAKKDEEDLQRLFRDFKFDVECYRDLKCSDMKSKIRAFTKKRSLKQYDMSIVVMMSHGSNTDCSGKTIGGGYTEIFGTDNKGYSVDELISEFSSINCPYLIGKPKIFILQCCRGKNDEKIARDAAPIMNAIKSHADILIAFSTLPSFFSNRDCVQGTWYIQSICSVFRRHAKTYDIENLLKIVDNELGQKHPLYKQTSMYESRGFKRCFLNPN